MQEKTRGFTPSLKFRPFLSRPRLSWRDRASWRFVNSHNFGWKRKPQPKFSAGFTLMEAVVVLGIITMLSSVTLISFSGVSDALALRRERYQVALALREAQNMALAVRLLSGGVTAPAYGVRLQQNSSTYFLFADSNNNRIFDGADTKIGSDRIMEKGIKVNAFNPSSGTVYLSFASPEADVRIANGSGGNLGEWIEITLSNRSGNMTSRLRVRTSGQVTLR